MHVMHVFKVYTALPQWGKLLWFQKFYLLSFLKWVSSKSFHCYFGRNAKTESDRNLFWKISRFVLVIKRAPVQQFFFLNEEAFLKIFSRFNKNFFSRVIQPAATIKCHNHVSRIKELPSITAAFRAIHGEAFYEKYFTAKYFTK